MKHTCGDRLFKWGCLFCAAMALLLLFGFFAQLTAGSAEAWRRFGFGFLISSDWDPVAGNFGALPAITGTLLTTAIALIAALPLAFAAAMYLTDAPKPVAVLLGHAVDLLAAIPSVIYGMWGLFVLVPLMQDHVQPFLVDRLGLGGLWFVNRDFNGFGIFTAGIILAVMILPYICAVMRDVFVMTPPVLRESAFGVGCTRWEVARDIVLGYGMKGVMGGVFIGLGRALGETMAVLFVIGNVMQMPDGIFSGSTTIAATLANNFPEADGLQKSALFALGLILLFMSFGIQALSQYCLRADAARRGER